MLATIMNAVLAVILLVGTVVYQIVGGKVIQISTSSIFVLMGLVNLCFAIRKREKNLKFYIAMAAALFLCMMGDIMLRKDFVLGAATFASGHIAFLVSYYFLQKARMKDFVIGGILFAMVGSFLMFCPLLTFSDEYMRWVSLAYAFIISMMVGKAVSNYLVNRTKDGLLRAIGSSMFFFSDFMLVCNWFMDTGSITRKLCMITYFPALGVLALSMLVSLHEKNKQK